MPRRRPNRRQNSAALSNAGPGTAIYSIEFAGSGPVWTVIVNLNGPATIRETANPADLLGWGLIRYTGPQGFGAIIPQALTARADTAQGASFELEFDTSPGSINGTWRLLIPVDQRLVIGENAGHVTLWNDPQAPTAPPDGFAAFTVASRFGTLGVPDYELFWPTNAQVIDSSHIRVSFAGSIGTGIGINGLPPVSDTAGGAAIGINSVSADILDFEFGSPCASGSQITLAPWTVQLVTSTGAYCVPFNVLTT